MDLSIIIPGCNEFPQNAFTVQNVIATLKYAPIEFEVLYIDNKSEYKVKNEHKRGFLDGKARPWLKTIHWDDKLSHWCAKNVGIENSTGKTLLFMDAHCIVEPEAIFKMWNYYLAYYDDINGSLHMPINYMLDRPGTELVYQCLYERQKGIVHYSFRRMFERKLVHKVPCMSTCGMMISRDIMENELGMWPWELGIYGGGENFINYTLAVLGRDVNIWPFNPIHHYAFDRGYSWNYDDWVRNRMIAIYMAGGVEWIDLFRTGLIALNKGRPEVLQKIRDDVVAKCTLQRGWIKDRSKLTIDEWWEKVKETYPKYIHSLSVLD